MTLPFKETRKKILAGDFSGLFKPNHQSGYIHPSEVAQLFISIPAGKAIDAYNSFSADQQVNVLPYLDIQLQKKIINNISKDRASYILNNLKSDDRTIFYSSLRGIELSRVLEYLDEQNRDAVANLLGYSPKSVARIINTDVATVDATTMTIEEASEHLRLEHNDTEAANVIYVVDSEGKLIDDIPIRRLVLNERSKKIMDIVDGFCVTLKITETKEDAVQKFKEYDRVVLPVINDEHVLLGVVTIDDVMDVAEQKATAEIQKFGGIEELDFPYVKTPFFSLLKKRAGWLIVLFLGEMLTATAMGYFDGEI
ncbi:magnesium transporter [Pedobacter sp. NJ-S-72]